MLNQTNERAVMLGTYISEHCATVRAAAKQYGISKSTVHMDVPKENGKKRFLNNFHHIENSS